MKKLIAIIFFLWSALAHAQNYSSPGIPPGTTSTPITTRIKPATPDSLAQIWIGIGGNKFYRMMTGIDDIVFSAINFKGAGTTSSKLDLNNSIHLNAFVRADSGFTTGDTTSTNRKFVSIGRKVAGIGITGRLSVNSSNGGGVQIQTDRYDKTVGFWVPVDANYPFYTPNAAEGHAYPVATTFIPIHTADSTVKIWHGQFVIDTTASGVTGAYLPLVLPSDQIVSINTHQLAFRDSTNTYDPLRIYSDGTVGINQSYAQTSDFYALTVYNSKAAGYFLAGNFSVDATGQATTFTPSAHDNSTKVATTAYVDAATSGLGSGTVTSITPGIGFTSHTPITTSGTMDVDTASTIQTIANFFPKGDTRYYKASNPSNYIALTAISATSPIFYNSTTGVISSQAATSGQNGYLTSTDWNTFNGKQAALVSGTNIKTINGSSILGSGNIVVGSSTTPITEVPSGTLNGSNVTFTATHTPISGSLSITYNGLQLQPTVDYTLSGATATLLLTGHLSSAPISTDYLLFNYQY